ncbi:MAG: hypothetical protein ACRDLL_17490 [Solirubrobacterales bacterium]
MDDVRDIMDREGRTPLAAYPRDVPLRAQVAMVEEAKRRARALGAVLPVITWCWVWANRELGVQHGEIHYQRGRAPTVYLRSDLFPEDLKRTILHELRHAADIELMLKFTEPRFRGLFERRAIDFAERGMATWR